MAIYYINADNGDNANDGSSGSPWETLAYADDNSATGDTIICQDSTATYSWVSGNLANRTIKATTFGDAVFDAGGSDVEWNIGPNNTFENLKFQNNGKPSANDQPIFAYDNGGVVNIVFTNCWFDKIVSEQNSGRMGGMFGTDQAYNQGDCTLTFNSCVFNDCYQATVGGGSSLLNLRTSVANTFDFNFYNCTFYFETAGGDELQYVFHSYDQTASATINVTMANCILRNNTGITVTFDKLIGSTSFNYSLSYSCFNNMTSVPSTSNSITGDPLFIDEPNADFRLRQSSPCVDQGTII